MARPHPALLELLDDRPVAISPELVESAREHRLFGLAWSAMNRSDPECPPELRRRLALLDLAEIASHDRQWRALATVVDVLADRGIRVVALKGVTAEQRFFDRTGERPSVDLDVLVADPHRIGEAVSLLHSGHPLAETCQHLVDTGTLQSVDLMVDGVPVDLHVDPLKLGLAWRGRDEWLRRTQSLPRPDGGAVEVFDVATTMVMMLVHAGRDRFRYRLSLIECARIGAAVDWHDVGSLAATEGIGDQVLVAAEAIAHEMGIDSPAPSGGWRVRLWRRLWREETRVLGRLGEVRFLRRAQWLLPLTARGRSVEAIRHLATTVFPPRDVVAFRHGDGPYLWRLLAGRVGVVARRRLEAVALRIGSGNR